MCLLLRGGGPRNFFVHSGGGGAMRKHRKNRELAGEKKKKNYGILAIFGPGIGTTGSFGAKWGGKTGVGGGVSLGGGAGPLPFETQPPPGREKKSQIAPGTKSGCRGKQSGYCRVEGGDRLGDGGGGTKDGGQNSANFKGIAAPREDRHPRPL